MGDFSVPYLPTIGSPEGLAQTLLHLAPELAVLAGHTLKASITNKTGAYVTKYAVTDTYYKILFAQDVQNIEGKKPPPPPKSKEDYGKLEPSPKWGALGDIVFDILSGPTTLSSKESVAYVQHKVIGAKPHVQFTAPELRTVTLTLAWHSMLMEDIEAKHKQILDAMNTQQILPLVVGEQSAGTHPGGTYVITSVDTTVERFWENGRIMSLELTVELLEWNTGGPLEPGQHSGTPGVAGGGGNTPAQNAGGGTNGDLTRKGK